MERGKALVEAMLFAAEENPDILDDLVEMADENDDEEEDQDPAPPIPAAQQRVAAWLKRISDPKNFKEK